MHDLEKKAEDAIEYVTDVCDNIGPRYSGSEAEKKCALDLKNRLDKFSDETVWHDFSVRPDLYPEGLVTISVLVVLISVWTVVLRYPWNLISLFGPMFGLFIFTVSLILMKDWFGFFFAKKTSHNALGKIKAKQDSPKNKKVIISGHIDSATFMKVTELGDRIALVTLGGLGWVLLSMLITIIKSIWITADPGIIIVQSTGFAITFLDIIWAISAIVGLPTLIYLKMAYTGKEIVPGANDNLIAVGIALSIGEYFSKEENKLDNVDLWVGGFGSEECGERGAEYFVKVMSKKGELENSYTIVPESCGGGTHLAILKEEKMHLVTHNMDLCEKVKAGYEQYKSEHEDWDVLPCDILSLPYSASDAGRFSLKGYNATTVLGYEGAIMKPTNWHALTDTPENLRKNNVRDVLGIYVSFIKMLDSELSDDF